MNRNRLQLRVRPVDLYAKTRARLTPGGAHPPQLAERRPAPASSSGARREADRTSDREEPR